jgi:hypothetical protein
VLIAAAADYVLKSYRASLFAWQLVPGSGQKGTRATIPFAITPTRGCRFKLQVTATSAGTMADRGAGRSARARDGGGMKTDATSDRTSNRLSQQYVQWAVGDGVTTEFFLSKTIGRPTRC